MRTESRLGEKETEEEEKIREKRLLFNHLSKDRSRTDISVGKGAIYSEVRVDDLVLK